MSREQFYKVYGRYPVTKEDTEILDIGGDHSDEEISKLVQLTCDLDTAPDTPQGLRSPVTVDKIEQNIYKWYKDKEQKRKDMEEDELFREKIRAYWDSKKKKKNNENEKNQTHLRADGPDVTGVSNPACVENEHMFLDGNQLKDRIVTVHHVANKLVYLLSITIVTHINIIRL